MSTADQRRTLSTKRVVFIVIAAAAPMAAMVGNVPLALVYGNGAGLPAAFVIAGVVLLCFSVGYAEMSRRVVNTGAFYTYISRSLGKPLGVGAAYVALGAYTAMSCGLAGAFGYFTREVVKSAVGIDISWLVFSLIGVAIVAMLGYRSVDVSAKVLGTLMILEFAILFVFSLQVIGAKHTAALPLESFSRPQILSGSVGIALIFAFTSFIGFESAALYGEETKDPQHSIPRATYIAVSTVAVFYVFMTWIIVGAAGVDNAVSTAKNDGGVFVLNLIQKYGGEIMFDVTAVLLCTSVLASYSALHNAASRYLFALGREAIMPKIFAQYHPEYFSPHIASIAITTVATMTSLAFAIAQVDPYSVFAASLIGVGTLGIVALQALASLSVIAFFRRRNDRHVWKSVLAPLVGFIGLTTAFILAATHYALLTGSSNRAVNLVPVLLIVLLAIGILKGIRLRKTKPAVYARLASSQLRGTQTRAVTNVDYTSKYCIVGAGPSGLVIARALQREGVPFDWFERHTDVAGIWDMENSGSPMYDSAHFISSKYTSAFVGYPMPSEYPDYPNWRQIRDYIRSFARDYGLADKVRLGTSVESAEPQADSTWRVTLNDGEVRTYTGVIVATGTNWHPNHIDIAGIDSFTGDVMHSVDYRHASSFTGKRVLIVGAGNSGVDIACDAGRNSTQAYLSVRRGYRYIPKHIFGVPTDALLSGVIAPPKGVSMGGGDANKLIDTLVGDLTRLGLPAPDHDVLTSHPIMNTQVLYHLAHGDVIAKPDVSHVESSEVVFVDGTREQIDLIVLATGYQYQVPFLKAPELEWNHGRPQLYLKLFARAYPTLYFMGFAEFADAAYKRFEDMANLIVMDIHQRETGIDYDKWLNRKRNDQPDLSGGMQYIDSPRHSSYIDVDTYRGYLAEIRDEYSWPDVSEAGLALSASLN